jgi:hypothetical protein
LKEADVPVIFKEFPEALHGFLEVNYPDFKVRILIGFKEMRKLSYIFGFKSHRFSFVNHVASLDLFYRGRLFPT